MSFDKIAKQLENPAVKLDILARYAQGANPAVPEFLALAEIKRRQSLTQHSAAPAPTTVQEDLVRQAMPQPMMQAPQQMPQEAQQGLPGMQRPQGVAALPSGMDAQSMAGGGIVAFADGGATEDDEDLSMSERFARFKERLNKSIGGANYDPRVGAPVNATPYEIQKALGASGFQAPKPPVEIPVTGYENQPQAYNLSNQTDPAPYMGGEAPSPAMQKASTKDTNKSVVFKGADKATEEAAPKEDIYSKYEKMLMEQATEGKEARKNDKYMRMLEAGLGIMGGTSPYLATNLGQGAMGAAKGYAQDKAEARKEDRANVKELMALGMRKEEAKIKAKELSIKEKEAADKGQYYTSYADFLRSGKGAGAAADTKLNIAQNRNAVDLYKKMLEEDPYHMQNSDEQKWRDAQQRAGMSGGMASGPVGNTVQWGSLGAKKS